MTVRVLIVDDSAVVRQVLTAVLERDPGVKVIGAASDPIFAMEKMNHDWPDVVVLDVEMPRMDGITFLRKLMAVRPTPVVICSTLTERGAQTTMEAMAAGAVGFVTKPTSGLKAFLESDGGDIVEAVKSAAAGDIRRTKAASMSLAGARAAHPSSPASTTTAAVPAPRATSLPVTTDRVVAIGTSTGGTQAIEVVLTGLPRIAPGIVIVQHMPEKFTAALADRLNGLCESDVREAADGDRVLPGHVLIAPGGRHMSLVRDGAQYRVRISDGERVNRHKPSVDVLFGSVARVAGRNALGVIMTGMGDDGARGLKAMRDAGASTLGQDERSCVVYGMPEVALRLGAVERELPLEALASAIERYARVS